MTTILYVASTETFVGKSAVCMAMMHRMRHDGLRVGYMKPVSVSVTHQSDATLDEDAVLIQETMGLSVPIERMAPVLITPSVVDAVLNGEIPDFRSKIQESFRLVSRETDVIVMEGTNRWVEGAMVDLAADQVIAMFNAPVLLVCRYQSPITVDNILTVQRYLDNRIVGVLINQIEPVHQDFVRNKVVPFLESQRIGVLGMLPHETFLASITVGEILDHLGGQFIGSPEWREKVVESMMIGAMGVEAGLSFFRRRPNKVVITGGDRVDLQLVALETSTSALILSGNMRPTLNVQNRAEEREVPIIVFPGDTLSAVEQVEQLFGRVRFRQHTKRQHFIKMMEAHFDYQRLYRTIGLEP